MNKQTLNRLKPFLYGKLLGDATLEKPKKPTHNSRIKIKHNKQHKEYVEICKNKIHNFSTKLYLDSSIRIHKGIQRRHYAWCFKSKALPVFSELRKEWYDKKKVLPKDLRDFFTVETLAYFYLDDGYIQISGKYVRAVFCTDNFSEEEVEELISIINSYFGLNAVKIKYKGNFRISIRKAKNVKKLFSLIEEFVPNCLLYKIRIPQ